MERLDAGTGFEDFVALPLQQLAGEAAQADLVFNQQHLLVAPAWSLMEGGLGLGARRFGTSGQEHLEDGPLADFTVHFDPSVMLFDNAVHGGQSETRSLPHRFGGEKRFEYSQQMFRRDAAPRVADAQAGKLARTRFGVLLSIGLVDFHSRSAQGELSSPGHGVAGIDRQVQDDLLDHSQIGVDVNRFGGEMELHGDVLAHQSLQHSAHGADDFVEFERLGLHDLLSAEGQQLAGQVRGALCGGAHLFETFGALGAQLLGFQEHGRVTQDDAEDVVEVMGHPGRQLADRRQSLLLHDRLLAQAQFVVSRLQVGVQSRMVRRQGDVLAQAAEEFGFGLAESADAAPSHDEDAEDLVLR